MKALFLYRISQSENRGYDTYDSAVVAANGPGQAACIHSGGGQSCFFDVESGRWMDRYYNMKMDRTLLSRWATHPDMVTVEHIGITPENSELQVGDVLCSSFNAG